MRMDNMKYYINLDLEENMFPSLDLDVNMVPIQVVKDKSTP